MSVSCSKCGKELGLGFRQKRGASYCGKSCIPVETQANLLRRLKDWWFETISADL